MGKIQSKQSKIRLKSQYTMINFNKVLVATVASFLALEAEAKPIHNSCLKLSDQMAGQERGEFISNED